MASDAAARLEHDRLLAELMAKQERLLAEWPEVPEAVLAELAEQSARAAEAIVAAHNSPRQ